MMAIKPSLELTIYLNKDKDNKPFSALRNLLGQKKDPKKDYDKESLVENGRYHGEISRGIYGKKGSAMHWWLDGARAAVSPGEGESVPELRTEIQGKLLVGESEVAVGAEGEVEVPVQGSDGRGIGMGCPLRRVSSPARRMDLEGPILRVPGGRGLLSRRERLREFLRW